MRLMLLKTIEAAVVVTTDAAFAIAAVARSLDRAGTRVRHRCYPLATGSVHDRHA